MNNTSTVTIAKGAAMNSRDPIAFAKSGAVSKPEFFEALSRKADALRKRGETREQAFQKFVEGDPDGVELYQAYREMRGPLCSLASMPE